MGLIGDDPENHPEKSAIPTAKPYIQLMRLKTWFNPY